jgi:hypothetical protein
MKVMKILKLMEILKELIIIVYNLVNYKEFFYERFNLVVGQKTSTLKI